VYYLPGGDRLVTATRGGRITIWNAENGQLLSRLLPELPLSSAAVSPDGRTIFTAHSNGEVSAWDISSPGRAEWLAAPTGGGARAGVLLSPDGSHLLGWNLLDISQRKWGFTLWGIDGDQLKQAGGYTVIPEKPLSYYKDFNATFYSGLVFDFGPARIAFGISFEGVWECQVFNAVTGELVKTLEIGNGVSSFKLNSDGSQLFIGRPYGMVDVWDVAANHRLTSFRVSQEQAFDLPIYLTLSGDDTRLLTWGSSDPVVHVWDTVSKKLLKEFSGTDGTICGPALTPDKKFLVTCGNDHTVLIWDAASGKLSRSIKLPDIPNLVQVSPDQRYLVASLVSSLTVVYDFASGRELVTLQGSSSTIYTGNLIKVVNQERIPYPFSPDGKHILITLPADQTAYGFVLDNNELVRLACQRLAAITLPDSRGKVTLLPICLANSARPGK
jgi:WD40 repeat protein